ncbi:MAG: hypothetical protein EXS12_09510 [Phycisphaerales bacterium]|nr:hypothetical protein [Phycisphaerales bacterium]
MFNFEPGVFAVGGNFFSRDASFNTIPALIGVFFENGTSSLQYVSTVNDFSGFISSVAITKLIVEVFPFDAGHYPTVDNLYFGVVPAPGAAALLSLAALVSRRRR